LAIVDTGVDPYMGVAVWLEAHKQNEFRYRPAQDRTAVQRFGEMNAAEALQVLVPLFIVLLTFSAFAGEREQGTLRQLLSLGVRPRDLALGKAFGVATALGLVLVPATVFGVVALAFTSDDGLLLDQPSRALWLLAFFLLYFAIIIAVSLGVSARARSARVALLVLLTLWFANSLVAPRVSADVAAWLYPTPSAVEFQKSMDADLNDQHELQQRLERRKAELLQRYGAASIDAVPVAFSGVSLQEGENHGNEVFDRHYGRLFDIYDRQNAAVQFSALVAPMLAMRTISMGLAGTDFQQHRDFVSAAEDYRRLIQRTMNDDITAHPTKRGGVYLAGPELWEKVPQFEYVAPPASWVIGHIAWSAAILGLWLVVAMVWMSRHIAGPAI
jgi:ABC-2 type transport system permease protein